MFELERDMIPGIISSGPEMFPKRGLYAIVEEVPDGRRVVDVMFALFPDNSPADENLKELSKCLESLSIAQLIILAKILEEKRITTAKLSRLTYLSKDSLEKEYLSVFLSTV